MVEGGRLESVWAATSRGFESLLLRQTFSETLLLPGSRFQYFKAPVVLLIQGVFFCPLILK